MLYLCFDISNTSFWLIMYTCTYMFHLCTCRTRYSNFIHSQALCFETVWLIWTLWTCVQFLCCWCSFAGVGLSERHTWPDNQQTDSPTSHTRHEMCYLLVSFAILFTSCLLLLIFITSLVDISLIYMCVCTPVCVCVWVQYLCLFYSINCLLSTCLWIYTWVSICCCCWCCWCYFHHIK